jgi:hypothetical protein
MFEKHALENKKNEIVENQIVENKIVENISNNIEELKVDNN